MCLKVVRQGAGESEVWAEIHFHSDVHAASAAFCFDEGRLFSEKANNAEF